MVLASLWRVRNELHVGQNELARRSQVSQRMIALLERGERRARHHATQQLAFALGVKSEDLIEEDSIPDAWIFIGPSGLLNLNPLDPGPDNIDPKG